MQDIVLSKSLEIITIARLPSTNFDNISQIVDTGVDGILYPHVEERSQIDKFVQETFLPPHGKRGFSPFVPK